MTRRLDKVCIVAGGGNGIGEAVARSLAEHGARVVVNDLGTSVHGEGRDETVAESTAEEIRGAGGEAVAHAGDLTDAEYAEALVDAAVEEYGRLDFVANFVGILRDGIGYRMDEADWRAVIETNLTGQFTLLRAVCAHWRAVAGDSGLDAQRSYVAASSNAARGNAGQANYAASKAGVLGLVRTVASEMHRHGVRVNALIPNAFTRMTETVPEEHRPYTRDEMPADKVAPLVAYLASDAADDVTGCTLYAGGDRVGVFTDPHPERIGVRPDGWSLDELAEHFRSDVADGLDLTRTDDYL